MSQADTAPTQASEAAATAPAAEVAISVDLLQLNKALRFDMHDATGLLLLAAGQVVTPEFKRLLDTRQIREVSIRAEDAAEINGTSASTTVDVSRVPLLDPKIQAQLQKVLENGLKNVQNRGPAFRQRVTRHGCKGYDAELQADIAAQQAEVTGKLSSLMDYAQNGRFAQITGTVFQSVQSSLKLLSDDIDGCLSHRLTGQVDRALTEHCQLMSQLAMAIAIELGLNAENVCRIGVTGLLHDWGWLRVPREIREAKRPLTRIEQLQVERHPAHSVDLMERIDGLPQLVPLVSYQVHERLNGTGYPRRRSDPNIHLFARILHVADDYVALTTPNGWRPPLMPYIAMDVLLRQMRGRAADPMVLRCLLRVLSLFPIGSHVKLADGSEAEVLRCNGDRYTQPIVRLLRDTNGQPIDAKSEAAIIDLSESTLAIVAAIPNPERGELTELPDPTAFLRGDFAHPAVSAPKRVENFSRHAT